MALTDGERITPKVVYENWSDIEFIPAPDWYTHDEPIYFLKIQYINLYREYLIKDAGKEIVAASH